MIREELYAERGAVWFTETPYARLLRSMKDASPDAHLYQLKAALPVALDAILEPIEALHRRVANPVPNSTTVHLCAADRDFYPCPTRRACDQIRAEYGGGQ